MRAVLRDDQRSWFGEIEHLPGDMVRRHRRGQRCAARRARLRIMVDGGIGRFGPPQRLTRMALLAPVFLPDGSRRLLTRALQPVAGRWLAAVAALQPKTTLQFRQPPHKYRDLTAKRRILAPQCRYDRLSARRRVVSVERVFRWCHRHVDSCRAVTCQEIPSKDDLGCYEKLKIFVYENCGRYAENANLGQKICPITFSHHPYDAENWANWGDGLGKNRI